MSPMLSNESVAIKSVGCRTNQEEMGALEDRLVGRGYSIVDDIGDAQIIIVNTCSVTSCTESKTRRLIESISRKAPHARIMLTGCLAQQKPDELAGATGVHWIVGNGHKDRIPEILADSAGGMFCSPLTTATVLQCVPEISTESSRRTRLAVKIQEGCDFRCSYCIVPLLRGPSRSAPLHQIVESCGRAIDAGYKELVLTGTHIGQFRGLGGENLVGLLESILVFPGDFRIRLSSLDPRDLTGNLIELVLSSDRICDHLHVSLQSLDPDVLRGMGRPYADLDRLLDMLQEFRRRKPSAGLGADLIVGFPGEDGSMFERTLGVAQQIRFSYAHIFRYSKRPGTGASVLSGQVSERLKTERSAALHQVVADSRRQFIDGLIGSKHRIIVESVDPLRGLTSNYIHIEIPRAQAPRNSWLDVCLEGPGQTRYCRGSIPEKSEAS